MPKDPFIREKFTKECTAARNFAQECFERCPEDRYQTEVATPPTLCLAAGLTFLRNSIR
jgi:hypothetical protein